MVNSVIRRISDAAATVSVSCSIGPGDVALDNRIVLEPDMLFMIHPNQYLRRPVICSAASR